MRISDMRVRGHRVLLKPEFPEEVTESGIVISTQTQLKQEKAATDTGRVIAVGNTCWHSFDRYTPDGKRNPSWAPWCEVGDLVLFAKYGGKFVTVGDETYVVVNDEDIQGVLEVGNE